MNGLRHDAREYGCFCNLDTCLFGDGIKRGCLLSKNEKAEGEKAKAKKGKRLLDTHTKQNMAGGASDFCLPAWFVLVVPFSFGEGIKFSAVPAII